ncbi:protein FAR1-RELATED SEQUENCE 5-like isoform X2 [Chenopodium quinoa]|uniref:protein FAR1-RELATED SEQUENCE 5-like isoform X2 n=2 Tax=Chenopodium quinoa TaxID=63459 RepID=UPI000B77D48C|nr:protein FAR1-RELATED SEQUENCE 5-like isoform X2 [Chenopodium quinoa]
MILNPIFSLSSIDQPTSIFDLHFSLANSSSSFDFLNEFVNCYRSSMANSASGDCVDFDRDCERVFPSGLRFVDSFVQQLEKNDDIMYLEAEQSELKDKEFKSEDEAFEAYNEYAFRKGFGIRIGKSKRRRDDSFLMKRFVCCNEGFKDNKCKNKRIYEKLDHRTGCLAFVQFHIDHLGVYTCTRHEMVHNHAMIPPEKRHLIRSQRDVNKEQLLFISTMKLSGVKVTDSLRVLKKEVGGSPNLCFTASDAYNALSSEKAAQIEGCDGNQLIKYFAKRHVDETDFYYDFEQDDSGALVSFFWRDGRMMRYYHYFGDLLVFDTTYRTNKYGMICAPFVGMNHHGNNVMFGMGFILNERTESFDWLFDTFLHSMGRKSPITIMTDQAQAIAAGIRNIFPSTVHHRLCVWHLEQNSKKHIGALRALEGFTDLFGYLLKYCETPAEFEYFWKRMCDKYKCENDDWLCDLYKIKEMWCPAYSKKYWSGGILSSQRSETTNKSVSQRLNKTQGLCDFYHVFLDVISEWRSKEGARDYNTLRGNRHLAFANIGILVHARSLYTIQAYVLFEEEFIRGTAYDHVDNGLRFPEYSYLLWRPGKDIIKHEVVFNKETHAICCTCMYFSETGLLCSHSLRVYHLHCVRNIPQEYIMKRWTKAAMCSHGIEEPTLRTNVVATSVWRSQTIRKFVKLITSCQNSLNARAEVECYFNLLKEKVESVSGVIDFSEPVKEVEIVDLEIKNPPKARPKGERNVRPKSTLEKQCNKAKGNFKRKKSLYTPYKRGIGQAVVQELDENGCAVTYANSISDPIELIVLSNKRAQVGLKSAVVEEIPSSSKESNHSISNDFDQAKDLNLEGVSAVQPCSNFGANEGASGVKTYSQINPRVPIHTSASTKSPVVIQPTVPRNVQNQTQNCSNTNPEMIISNSRNVQSTNVQVISPTVQINDQGFPVQNVQVTPPTVQRNDQGARVPILQSRNVQLGSKKISSKYDRLLAFFDTSVAKRLANKDK